MSKGDLRAYVLQHPDDNEAFYELSDRIKANAKPLNVNELPEIIQRKRSSNPQ
ncbi:DUF6887 family protein [Tolypothrix sp. NIES-4075]|uniref:DUF6887 family protein n=1 Tax=Tolypothrix sp. NIES-4075 TaxID=2005459 RepID=UPI001F339E17|nr:hypothetical protein [Tolypothrix sp. NIES-4075]